MSEQFENIRILKIRCKNHYLFGDMEFDFTNNGQPVDTIIIAGENGAGKSTLLELIYTIVGTYDFHIIGYPINIEADLLINGEEVLLHISVNERGGANIGFSDRKNHSLTAIFSDVAINYNKKQSITSVTSLNVDVKVRAMKSDDNLAHDIEQLLVDVYSLDATDYYTEAISAKETGNSVDSIATDRRIARFRNAYREMFGDSLVLKGVDNVNGKSIYFVNKKDQKILLNKLSSGEKQIVFRGGYLLKDKNALKGATVFIDEPEISLHPEWQKKIMNYYKRIFTDENGVQTSQIFAVTHSPFIIHNENRYNDKVIILKKNINGKIYVDDSPSFYDCNSVKVVEKAFNIYDFSDNLKPTVYVEGTTDEQYLKNVAETFDMKLKFDIKWIGEKTSKGKDKNTGCTALDAASNVLSKMQQKNMLLYDCDTKKGNNKLGQLFVKTLKQYDNKQSIMVGIENALILDSIDMKEFYMEHQSVDEKGAKHINEELEKTKLCDYICSLNIEERKAIFLNLKTELENIISLLG